MNLGVVWLDQRMTILLTINKHWLQSLLLWFAYADNNRSAEAVNSIRSVLCEFKETNQICSPLKISQSVNTE